MSIKSKQAIDIGLRLKKSRSALGLTQGALAKAATASLQTIKSYESGLRIPSGPILAGLARAGINVDYLMGVTDGPMLVPASAKSAHTLRISAVEEDQTASRLYEAHVEMELEKYRGRQEGIDESAARVGYRLPSLVRDALLIALTNGMAEHALDTVIGLLKAQSILDRDKA